MDYAIIRLGGKQYRVREGETLVVDRIKTDEGNTFSPDVLLGEGTVTAKVIAHERGPKIRIGKYKRRTGYKRHNGFRAATTRIEISLGGAAATGAPEKAPPAEEPAETPVPVEASEPVAEATVAEAPVDEAPVDEAPAEAETAPAGLPEGYEKMTVAQVSEGAKTWDHATLETALDYEQAHSARKGAIAALESALKKEGH
jgi:large subunit ribosomal protein L21